MARVTINTLVNQIKKVIVNKTSIPAAATAYINGKGDITAVNFSDYEIKAFIAGVFADAAAEDLNKCYNKDSLALYTKTGALVNGEELPENCAEFFKVPEDNFVMLCTVTPETLKNCVAAVSKDNSRPYLTGININTNDAYIEAVDGFRSYRAPVELVGSAAHDVIIPGLAASYGYKGAVEIAAGEKYARLTDTLTGFTVYARMLNGPFVNIEKIYEKSYKYKAVIVKDLEKITPYLKAACKLERENKLTYIRFKDSRLDYAIPALNVYGSLETDGHEAGAAAAYNPAFLLDAIAAAGNTFVYNPDSMMQGPLTIGEAGSPEALLLPIRCDRYEVNDVFKALDIKGRTPEEDNKPEEMPAPDHMEEETTPTPVEDVTPEAAAVAAINEKQNKENRFVNITPEDVKRQQAITAAQAYYKALRGYKVSTIQAITAEAIYQVNREILQPIARRAGGLYIDNIAIIAAITAAADLYELQEV
jgi:DNA polymerase III sliding clamp (beta) subunit (PCNA family)